MKISAQENKKNDQDYIYYFDSFGQKKKAVVAKAQQILIINGDSSFTISNEVLLHNYLQKQKGFDIINTPDSICSLLHSRIKGVVVIKQKK